MPFSPKHLRFKHSFGRVYGNWEAIYPLPLLTAWGVFPVEAASIFPLAPPYNITH